MTPRVSVVSTVYNGEAYADRAIPSLLAQTLDDFELILVDDGSDDRTPEILRELARRDARVRVMAPGRVGFAAALNYGIERARGEYIARQDFDDCSYPERLRLQVEFLDAHPEVGVVGAYFVQIDEDRGERYVRMLPTHHSEIVSAMARYIPFAHTLVTFRRRVWTEAGGYPAAQNLVDLRFWLRIGRLGWHFANIPVVLGEHHVHHSSWFNRSFKYADRQRDLARVQAEVVQAMGLPRWMYVFAIGRHAYAYLPAALKRLVRRGVVGPKERDV